MRAPTAKADWGDRLFDLFSRQEFHKSFIYLFIFDNFFIQTCLLEITFTTNLPKQLGLEAKRNADQLCFLLT